MTASMSSSGPSLGPSSDIPEDGPRSDDGETWPSQELIDSFLGTGFDFELRLGEHTPIPADDPLAAERARQFRDVLGLFCTGVTVVTSMSTSGPVGMTCQSFSSVSLEPPLVMFCPARTSRAWPLMRAAGFFCVNILDAGQRELSNVMATKGSEKFDGLGWTAAGTGAPVIDGVLGYVDCAIESVHEAGDHYIVVGRVKELAVGDGHGGRRDPATPLLFHRGAYTQPE